MKTGIEVLNHMIEQRKLSFKADWEDRHMYKLAWPSSYLDGVLWPLEIELGIIRDLRKARRLLLESEQKTNAKVTEKRQAAYRMPVVMDKTEETTRPVTPVRP